jgi:hypothetical protein
MSGELKRFALIGWSVEDIRCLKPDWSEDQCAAFLEMAEAGIKNAMMEAGYAYIERRLPPVAKEVVI